MPPETGQFTNQTYYFPEEVMIQILVRLPPKSLLRFKSVCKTWHTLIGSSFFVNRHLDINNSTIIDKEFCHLLHFEKPTTTPTMAGAAILLSPTNEIRELEGAPCLEGDDHQLGLHGRIHSVSRYGYTGIGDEDEEGFMTSIWGVVKGVYCIMIKGVRSNRCTLMLWNPGNRQVHVLPELPPPVFPPQIVEFLEGNTFNERTFACGFGYNRSTNDHMVLLVSIFGDEFDDFYHHCTFHLYSLNSNTWKVLDPFEIFEDTSLLHVYDHGGVAFAQHIDLFLIRAMNGGVYLNGACHWLISYGTSILSFDFEDVCFRVTLSTTGTTLEGKYLWLATADGQLAVVCTPVDVNCHLSHEFDVYVMEKNDAESSWVRAYSIILTSLSPGAFVGIVDDEFFVREANASGRVVSYQLGAAEPEKEGRVYCCVDDEWVSVFPYRGSLLSIKPGNSS